jgi:hypothetical protein
MLNLLHPFRNSVYSTFAAVARKPIMQKDFVSAVPPVRAGLHPSTGECRALITCKQGAARSGAHLREQKLLEKERG